MSRTLCKCGDWKYQSHLTNIIGIGLCRVIACQSCGHVYSILPDNIADNMQKMMAMIEELRQEVRQLRMRNYLDR